MAGMTQKELKKPYFHCGANWKGKYQKLVKDFTVTNTKNKQKWISRYINKLEVIIDFLLLIDIMVSLWLSLFTLFYYFSWNSGLLSYV